MPKPDNLVTRYLNEVIAMPGLPGVGIRRGCVLMAMREAGYDKAAAEMFACSNRSVLTEGDLHPMAREVYAALLAEDAATAFDLLLASPEAA